MSADTFKELVGVGHSAVTGSGANIIPAEGGPDRFHGRSSTTRASTRTNSPAYDLRPGPKYRARLAHYMYVYEEFSQPEIAKIMGVSRQRVQQYIAAVDPGLDGREEERRRNTERAKQILEHWDGIVRPLLLQGMSRSQILRELGVPTKTYDSIVVSLTEAEKAERRNNMRFDTHRGLTYSDEELLQWVRRAVKDIKVMTGPGYDKWHHTHPGSPSLPTITNRFETMKKICALADVPRSIDQFGGRDRYWTHERIAEAAKQLIEEIGYLPRQAQWERLRNDGRDLPSRSLIIVRFRSWTVFLDFLREEGVL